MSTQLNRLIKEILVDLEAALQATLVFVADNVSYHPHGEMLNEMLLEAGERRQFVTFAGKALGSDGKGHLTSLLNQLRGIEGYVSEFVAKDDNEREAFNSSRDSVLQQLQALRAELEELCKQRIATRRHYKADGSG